MMEVRTMRSVSGQPAGSFTQHTDRFVIDDDDVNSDTDAESEMSLKSRSFLHSVNDRVRKMLDHSSKDAIQDSNKHSFIWRMFMFDIGSICIHGKELLRQLTFHQNMKEISL